MGHPPVESVAVPERSRPGNGAVTENLCPQHACRRAVPPSGHALVIEDDHPRPLLPRCLEADHEKTRRRVAETLETPGREIRGKTTHLVSAATIAVGDGNLEVLAGEHAGGDADDSRPGGAGAHLDFDALACLGADRRAAPAAARDVAGLGGIKTGVEAIDRDRGTFTQGLPFLIAATANYREESEAREEQAPVAGESIDEGRTCIVPA